MVTPYENVYDIVSDFGKFFFYHYIFFTVQSIVGLQEIQAYIWVFINIVFDKINFDRCKTVLAVLSPLHYINLKGFISNLRFPYCI